MPFTDRSTHLPEPPDSSATVVLHRAAGDVRPGIEALVAETITQLREAEPFYRSPALALADIAGTVREALLIALDTLATPGLSGRSARFAWQLGGASDGQGLPLAPLIRGYRIAARLLWEALARAIVERHPDDASVLVPVASTFWTVVDRDTRLLADAHAGAQVNRGPPAPTEYGRCWARCFTGRPTRRASPARLPSSVSPSTGGSPWPCSATASTTAPGRSTSHQACGSCASCATASRWWLPCSATGRSPNWPAR